MTWSKAAVTRAGRPPTEVEPNCRCTMVSPGVATKRPAWAVSGSPASRVVPTFVHVEPSADSYAVNSSPERVSRSQCGRSRDTAPPAVSWVKSDWSLTPCPGVTITAA